MVKCSLWYRLPLSHPCSFKDSHLHISLSIPMVMPNFVLPSNMFPWCFNVRRASDKCGRAEDRPGLWPRERLQVVAAATATVPDCKTWHWKGEWVHVGKKSLYENLWTVLCCLDWSLFFCFLFCFCLLAIKDSLFSPTCLLLKIVFLPLVCC